MELDSAFALISHAIDTGSVAHGYLIVGDVGGDGDALVEKILLKLFPDAQDQVLAHSHPDVATLEPSGKSRQIKVDDMRERILEPMATTSFSGGWKVGVIRGADRLNENSGNAFLKSLEEPTPKTLYLLLTDQPDLILPTIVSRTQRIDLPLSEGVFEGDDYEFVARAFSRRDAHALAEMLKERKDAGEDADAALVRKAFFKTIMSFVRKIMRSGKLPDYVAFRNVNAVEDAYRQCERSIGEEAAISLMLDRIAFPPKEPNA